MARTLQVSIAVVGLSLFGFTNAAQANLITNGSFEVTTNFVDEGNDTMSLPVASPPCQVGRWSTAAWRGSGRPIPSLLPPAMAITFWT